MKIQPTPNDNPLRNASTDRNVVSDRLLTIDEVAAMTGLAVGTLYHFVSQERIPVVRLSKRCLRFRQFELSDWIQSLTIKARQKHKE